MPVQLAWCADPVQGHRLAVLFVLLGGVEAFFTAMEGDGKRCPFGLFGCLVSPIAARLYVEIGLFV
ncbi:hypothetical protein [Cupriavidus necator]|uniref:hypothetical protein n=1 Tax=Cupriavidus necator TaxID=106590 RepID=UPI00339D7D62